MLQNGQLLNFSFFLNLIPYHSSRSKYERQEFLKPSLRILSNPKKYSLQASLSRKIMDSFRASSSSQKSVSLFNLIPA